MLKRTKKFLILGSSVSFTLGVASILYGGAYFIEERVILWETRVDARIYKFETRIDKFETRLNEKIDTFEARVIPKYTMEAILNQSDEDMHVNDLIMRIKLFTELNTNKKKFMDECYESHITAQSFAYDRHILKEGTQPSCWEDNSQYFEGVLSVQRILVRYKREMDCTIKEIEEMKIELDGRTWRYIV